MTTKNLQIETSVVVNQEATANNISLSDSYPTIKPSLSLDFVNNQSLDPRITFTRASYATYIDPKTKLLKYAVNDQPRFEKEGLLIEESRTNILDNTNRFLNSKWSKSNIIPIYNSSLAPDGTFTASNIIADTTNSEHYIEYFTISTTTNISYAFSCYLKYSGSQYIRISIWNSVTTDYLITELDLINKSIIFTNNGGTATNAIASFTNIGNDWFKVSISGIPSSSNSGSLYSVRIQPKSSTNTISYAGTGSTGVYIWGAQLEQGSFPTSYIPSVESFTSRSSTGTFIGSNGLIQAANSNVARYEYNSVNLNLDPYLLLETQSTNLLSYSEQIDNAYWSIQYATISINSAVSPDGNTTADALVDNTTNVNHGIYKTLTKAASALPYTFSFYVKPIANKSTYVQYVINDGTSTNRAGIHFNMTTKSWGTIFVNGTFVLHNYGYQELTNGWFRVWISATTGTETTLQAMINSAYSGSTSGYAGDGTAQLYLWGIQLEQSYNMSSYIPTTSAAVTRNADVYTSTAQTRAAESVVISGTNFSEWYNPTEGSISAIFTPWDNTYNSILHFNDNTFANEINIRYASGGIVQLLINNNNSEQCNIYGSGNNTIGNTYTGSFAYKINDTISYMNGSQWGTPDTNVTIPIVNRLNIGSFYDGTDIAKIHIANIKYYPKRLTNSQLQNLSK